MPRSGTFAAEGECQSVQVFEGRNVKSNCAMNLEWNSVSRGRCARVNEPGEASRA